MNSKSFRSIFCLFAFFFLALLPPIAWSEPEPRDEIDLERFEETESYNDDFFEDFADSVDEETSPIDVAETPSVLSKVLLYLPNRIFDLFDIVRVRAKIGPGMGAGVRLTDYGELYLGSHASAFAGLPGPRQEPSLPMPLGLEGRGGIKFSLLDGTFSSGFSPNYSPTEVGLSLHVALAGADVMLDPVELVDALLGFFFIDIRSDDL